MRAEQVQVLSYRDSGRNVPFEFLMACVDGAGVLHQYSGVDEEISLDLESICKSGKSIFAQQTRATMQADDEAARERGDTPEMPRNAPTFVPPLTTKPGGLNENLGIKPQ